MEMGLFVYSNEWHTFDCQQIVKGTLVFWPAEKKNRSFVLDSISNNGWLFTRFRCNTDERQRCAIVVVVFVDFRQIFEFGLILCVRRRNVVAAFIGNNRLSTNTTQIRTSQPRSDTFLQKNGKMRFFWLWVCYFVKIMTTRQRLQHFFRFVRFQTNTTLDERWMKIFHKFQ